MSRSSLVAIAALVFFIAVHLYYLSSPFVSLEFVYGRYAEELLRDGLSAELRSYLELVANPLSSLFAIVPFYIFFDSSEFTTRLPGFLSGVFLALFVVFAIRRIKSGKAAALAMAIILLNPMYWVCSGLAYTDIPFCLFSGVGLLLCIMALLKDRPSLHWPAALSLSLSALIKYNGLVFFPVAALFIIIGLGKRSLRSLLPYAILALVVDLPVYLVMFNRYGFLIHPRLRLLHRPRLDMLYLYLPSYLMWLGLFMGPLILLPVYNMLTSAKRRVFSLIFIVALLFLCAVCGLSGFGGGYLSKLHDAGEYEMNVGWFEFVLGKRALGALLLFILALAIVAVVDIIAWMGKGRANLFFGIWLIAVLLIGSISRPANRYLLFIIVPLSVYLADILSCIDNRARTRWALRTYFALSLIVLASISFITTSFWIGTRGSASAAAVRYMNEHRLFPTYLDWRVTSHSLYLADESLLAGNEARARYMVSGRGSDEAETRGRVLFRRDVSLLGRPLITYEVIEIER